MRIYSEASHFHFGQAVKKMGEVEQARAVCEKGIEVTARKGDLHARAEIEAALSMLPV